MAEELHGRIRQEYIKLQEAFSCIEGVEKETANYPLKMVVNNYNVAVNAINFLNSKKLPEDTRKEIGCLERELNQFGERFVEFY
jgi:hypothetical protein